MKIAILGAAGRVCDYLIPMELNETDDELVLFARGAGRRLCQYADNPRVRLVDGDFTDDTALADALTGVDAVYLNDMQQLAPTRHVVAAVEKAGVDVFVGANILGIHDEVPGAMGRWNLSMVGQAGEDRLKGTAQVVFDSSIPSWTVLRLTWLYDEDGNEAYELVPQGEPFRNAQVTRQGVARGVFDILHDTSGQYARASLGIGEPDTYFAKPSFY
ncbi:MAG: epimerase [Propionibacteriaceae bacterium]|nr:epimerase [Propionibacteriaceae bacterium]